jgi:hypothetical protein
MSISDLLDQITKLRRTVPDLHTAAFSVITPPWTISRVLHRLPRTTSWTQKQDELNPLRAPSPRDAPSKSSKRAMATQPLISESGRGGSQGITFRSSGGAVAPVAVDLAWSGDSRWEPLVVAGCHHCRQGCRHARPCLPVGSRPRPGSGAT